ncbi:zinc finger protein 569 isoform X3 [Parambassis ranga]|uniref:Zinc finger protein 569 isoform X3 n=1 Tax=Parambassis ranga TaxID=210632 RepID=A0A6P7JUA3_9TELE|nr:zinc finger protein 569-like isoform X3 [Parambassis ranga]
MDESDAAGSRVDEAENRQRNGDTTSENLVGPSTEDIADVQESDITCKECGLKFTHLDVYRTHLHQHALEEEELQVEENGSGDAERWDKSSSTEPSESVQGLEEKGDLQKGYACPICGKVYTYLVSFRKHQKLHEISAPAETSHSEQTLQKYECPECGMLFIRRTRLLSHLRVHKLRRKSTPNRCDQCNKTFKSEKLWMMHVEKHKKNPFWCLSCAQGFTDEAALDKHLQSHSLKQDNGDEKSFHRPAQLLKCFGRPYQCTLCGKSFSQPGSFISHKRKHRRICAGATFDAKMGLIHKTPLTSFKEEPEMTVNPEELLGNEEDGQKSEDESSHEEFEDCEFSEDSDCGDPGHHLNVSSLTGSAGSDPTERVQTQELVNGESQGTGRHREHKYWEWECVECDMGFDEMENLHMHYIKHATGELPIA